MGLYNLQLLWAWVHIVEFAHKSENVFLTDSEVLPRIRVLLVRNNMSYHLHWGQSYPPQSSLLYIIGPFLHLGIIRCVQDVFVPHEHAIDRTGCSLEAALQSVVFSNGKGSSIIFSVGDGPDDGEAGYGRGGGGAIFGWRSVISHLFSTGRISVLALTPIAIWIIS